MRVPALDSTCSICVTELQTATATFAYISFDKRKRPIEVHWCPKHQKEVRSSKDGTFVSESNMVAHYRPL